MRIFVLAGMEGVNGIAHPEQVTAGCRDYETSRLWLTDKVNALTCGLLDGELTRSWWRTATATARTSCFR